MHDTSVAPDGVQATTGSRRAGVGDEARRDVAGDVLGRLDEHLRYTLLGVVVVERRSQIFPAAAQSPVACHRRADRIARCRTRRRSVAARRPSGTPASGTARGDLLSSPLPISPVHAPMSAAAAAKPQYQDRIDLEWPGLSGLSHRRRTNISAPSASSHNRSANDGFAQQFGLVSSSPTNISAPSASSHNRSANDGFAQQFGLVSSSPNKYQRAEREQPQQICK